MLARRGARTKRAARLLHAAQRAVHDKAYAEVQAAAEEATAAQAEAMLAPLMCRAALFLAPGFWLSLARACTQLASVDRVHKSSCASHPKARRPSARTPQRSAAACAE